MTTLYIDRRNLSLSVQNKALVFHEKQTHINTIPLKLIERVCIHGNLNLTARVLGKLGEASIGILVLNGRQQQPTLLMPNWKQDGKRRAAQYAQAQQPTFCLHFAKQLITTKLKQQHQLIQHTPAHTQSQAITQIINQIPSATNLATLRGLEGIAANYYFSAWQYLLPTTFPFQERNRRPPKDPINSLLSLGYTLLHFEIVKHIYLCGLDPYIGFYHCSQHGRASLACDLLEILRPQYDQWLINHCQQHTFRPQDFSQTSQGCRLNKEARIHYYSLYEKLAKTWRSQIHQHCAQTLSQLKPQDPDFHTSLDIITNPEPTHQESQS